jgi:fibronectin-binding autotransporter adhesin
MFRSMKLRLVAGCVIAIVAVQSAPLASAADVIKANNTSALNTGASWASGTAPTSSDVAVWNATVTGANSSALGGNVSWEGIKIQSPGGKVTITGNAANTLTLGSAGINMVSGTQQLEIGSAVTLLTSQTWTLNAGQPGGTDNSSVRFLAPSVPTSFSLGGNTLNLVGSGSVQLTSGYLITGGTINVGNSRLDVQSGNSGRQSVIGSDVTINVAAGKILRFGINSASTGLAVSSSAAIVLNSGTILIQSAGASGTNRLVQSGLVSMNNGSGISNESGFGYATQFTGGIAVSGSTNWLESNTGTATTTFSGPLTGNGTLSLANTSSRRIEWSGDNSAFSGAVGLSGGSGNRTLRLASGSAGSSLAAWSVGSGNILEVDGQSVSLGTLSGAGTVTNSHATNAAVVSIGSGTFTGLLTNGTGSGGLGLTKVGSGVLSLQGASTYTGPTSVSAGTLAVTSAYVGTSGSYSAVTLADGAALSVTQLTPTATYNASSLVLGSSTGSSLSLFLAGGATAAPITTGGLTLAGTSTVRLNVTPVAGMKLIAHSSPLVGDLSQLQLVGLPFRVNATLVDEGGSSINVGVVQNNVPKWTGAVNAVWNIDTTPNWVETDSGQSTLYLQSSSGTDAVVFDDSATGSTTITLNEAVTPVGMTFNNATKDYSISGAGSIGGSAGILKGGAAALTLATANTFAGGVALNDGRLNIGNAGALGSSKLTIAGGSLDNTSGAALTTTSAIAQDWNADFTFVGTNDLSFNGGAVTLNADRTVTVSAGQLAVGGVAGAGRALTKAGAGTLQIGASTYTGTTTVTGGTLKAASATSFLFTAGVTLANTAGVALDLNGFNQTITNLSGGGATGGNVVLGGATLTTGAAADATIGGLSGAGGIVKNGAGRLSILGSSAGFTGTTSITAGTLDVGQIGGVFGSGTIAISGANFIQASGTLTNPVAGGAAGISARGGDLVVNVGGTSALINLNSGGSGGLGQMTFGSPTADSRVIVQNQVGINNTDGTRTITVNSGTGGAASAELAGVVSNGGAVNGGIVKAGAGRLVLSAANTYTNSTTVNAGVLAIANPLALQFSTINTAGAGTYDVTGITTPTIGGLSGSTALASVVTAGYGSVTSLTINRPSGTASGTASYAGEIANGAAGMSLTKLGAGTQVFSGANTFSGPTTVNAGTIELRNQLALQNSTLTLSGTGGVVFGSAVAGNAFTLGGLAASNAAASLALQNSATTAIALSVGGNNASTTFAGSLTGAGSLLKGGTGSLVLSGSSTYSGPTSVAAGSLVVNGSLLSAVALSGSTASLGGSGSVGAISGAGLVGPGNSPGILTATSLDPTGGLSFAFEFTQAAPSYGSAAASDNDVLWLTSGTPFTSSLTAANTVSIYLTPSAAAIGTLTGGFFTTNASDFAANIADGSFQYFVQDAQGTFSYNGQNYVTLAEYDPAMSVTISTVSQNNGQVMQMVVVPEPGTLGLLGLAGLVAGIAQWRNRRAAGSRAMAG